MECRHRLTRRRRKRCMKAVTGRLHSCSQLDGKLIVASSTAVAYRGVIRPNADIPKWWEHRVVECSRSAEVSDRE
jgi:hypothetical protein